MLVLGVTAQKKTLEKKKERVQGNYSRNDPKNETVRSSKGLDRSREQCRSHSKNR